MRPPSYMRSVIDRNVVMRCTPVLLSRLLLDFSSTLFSFWLPNQSHICISRPSSMHQIPNYLMPLDVVTPIKSILIYSIAQHNYASLGY